MELEWWGLEWGVILIWWLSLFEIAFISVRKSLFCSVLLCSINTCLRGISISLAGGWLDGFLTTRRIPFVADSSLRH